MKYDSILFDMDGTLWDATLSYKEVWDVAFKELGLPYTVTTKELMGYMGLSLDQILHKIAARRNSVINKDIFLQKVEEVENKLMVTLGGIIYPGVRNGIENLSQKYRLFLVSNCARDGLRNFMKFADMGEFFNDSLSFGENKVPKSENMLKMIEKHNLKNPVYVGDTQIDCDEAHKAGIPFVYVKYGFGKCEDFDMSFDCFDDLVEYFNY